jgi:ATP-binding cassette subfamily C (CFTR/MRP) protein 1
MSANNYSPLYSLLTTANQRWLAIRLDFCGALLIFCVAIMSACNTTLSPSQIGLTLTCEFVAGNLAIRTYATTHRPYIAGSDVWHDDKAECRVGKQYECKLCSPITRSCNIHRCLLATAQAVERVLHYSSDQLPQERPHVIEETEPPESWPARGDIKFKDVTMSYRKGLPAVLKGM